MRTKFYLIIPIIFALSACKKDLSKPPVSDDRETEETELLTADVPAAPYTVRTIAGIFERTSTEPHVVNGPGPKAKFYKPHGISVDGDGSLYIADFFNGLIRKISIYNKVSTVELPPEY